MTVRSDVSQWIYMNSTNIMHIVKVVIVPKLFDNIERDLEHLGRDVVGSTTPANDANVTCAMLFSKIALILFIVLCFLSSALLSRNACCLFLFASNRITLTSGDSLMRV